LGAGTGSGGDGRTGLYLYNSSITSLNLVNGWPYSNNPITLIGTGGAGGIGNGGPYSYGGRGGDGVHVYSWNWDNAQVRTNADISLKGYGGFGGASNNGSGGNGGYGLNFEYGGGSPWNSAIRSNYYSVSVTGNGGAGGIGGGGNGVQGYGVKDAWAGAEGAVRAATSVTVSAQGGINLVATFENSASLTNSVSGNINFTSTGFYSGYGTTVSGNNGVAGGGFSLADYSGAGVTVGSAGITTSNGPVTVQADRNVTFDGAINAGTGAVSVTAGYGGYYGIITSNLAGTPAINAASATLSAANGIDLTSVVTALDVFNSGPGDVILTNTGILTVNRLVNIGGSITLDNTGEVTIAAGDSMSNGGVYAGYNMGSIPTVNTAGCDITITAHSPLTVNGTVAATGSISLTAGSSGTTADNLVINSTGGVFGGNNVTFTAGNAITFNAPAVNGYGAYTYGMPAANGSVFYAMQVGTGGFNSFPGQNPPSPPPAPPPVLPLDVSPFINDVISTMKRESTDLTDEEYEIYLGGRYGESGNVSYCN
jgi:hypothetical protein